MMPSIVTYPGHSDTETGNEGMMRNVIKKIERTRKIGFSLILLVALQITC